MQQAETATKRRSLPAVALVVTRILAGVLALGVLIQGALAGSHLTGGGGALDAHRLMGTTILSLLGLATAMTAGVAFRSNRLAFPVAAVAFFGLWAQIEMGFLGRLNIHLPLGIALFGVYLTLALSLRDRTTSTTKEKET